MYHAKMDIKNVQYEGVDWIHVTEDTDKWLALENLRVP